MPSVVLLYHTRSDGNGPGDCRKPRICCRESQRNWYPTSPQAPRGPGGYCDIDLTANKRRGHPSPLVPPLCLDHSRQPRDVLDRGADLETAIFL